MTNLRLRPIFLLFFLTFQNLFLSTSYSNDSYDLFPFARKTLKALEKLEEQNHQTEYKNKVAEMAGMALTGIVAVFDATIVHPFMLVGAASELVSERVQLKASKDRLKRMKAELDKDSVLSQLNRNDQTAISAEVFSIEPSKQSVIKHH